MNVALVDLDEIRRAVAEEVARVIAGIRPVPEPSDDGLLTAREVCDLLRVDRRTLRRLVLTGDVPRPITIGPRTLRWRRAAVTAWLAKLDRKALDQGRAGRLHGRPMHDHTADRGEPAA